MQAGKHRDGAVFWKIELLDSSQESAELLSCAELKRENMFSGKKIDDENFRLKNEIGDLNSAELSNSAPVPDPLPPPRLRPDREPSSLGVEARRMLRDTVFSHQRKGANRIRYPWRRGDSS